MAVVEQTMLQFTKGATNNHKFYLVQLHDDDSVTALWGRIGATGTLSQKGRGRTTYDRCIREKTRKGYEESKAQADLSVTDGASSARLDIVAAAQAALISEDTDAKVREVLDHFVKRIVADNRHAITEASGGRITVNDDGIVRTALGIVPLSNIADARKLLDKMAQQDAKGKLDTDLVDKYLMLVPQEVPRRAGWASEYLTQVTTVADQRDFLDQLESSIGLAQAAQQKALQDAKKDAKPLALPFRYSIDLLDPKDKKWKEIEKAFEATKNDRHHRDVSHLKLKRVFIVTDADDHQAAFAAAKKQHGNVRELWHGTLSGNLLSILRKGLYVPPVHGTSIRIAGRMFGDGIYFSDQSTKSLRYSAGSWGGSTGQSRDNCFMLFNEVVLGNEYRPHQQGGWQGHRSLEVAHKGADAKGRPFQSISVRGGTSGVMNNEIIVWDTKQIRVSYICEFDR